MNFIAQSIHTLPRTPVLASKAGMVFAIRVRSDTEVHPSGRDGSAIPDWGGPYEEFMVEHCSVDDLTKQDGA